MKRTHYSSISDTDKKESVEKELRLGYINLSDRCFDEAKANFMVALAEDEQCADAYWGLMLAKFNIEDEDLLAENPVTYKNITLLPEYTKAIEFADGDLKKIFEELIKEVEKINEGDKY